MWTRLTLVLTLVLSGLLSPQPAQAVVSLSLTTSELDVAQGATYVLNGKALGVPKGTVVHLQAKTLGGWQKVATKKVSSSKTVRFSRTAPSETLGFAFYRLYLPAQNGSPAAKSSTLTITVKQAIEIEYDVSVSQDAYEVDVTVTKGPSTGMMRLQEKTGAATWSDRDLGPTPGPDTLLSGYPVTPATVRLRIDGDDDFAPLTIALPSTDVVTHQVTLGEPFASSFTLEGGLESFVFPTKGGAAYSAYVSGLTNTSPAGAWFFSNDPAGQGSLPGFNDLFLPGSAGTGKAQWDSAVGGPLGGQTVTIYKAREVTLSGPNVENSTMVSPGQFVRFTTAPAVCPTLGFVSVDVTVPGTTTNAVVFVDGPGGNDNSIGFATETGTISVGCVHGGSYQIYIRRDYASAGQVKALYTVNLL